MGSRDDGGRSAYSSFASSSTSLLFYFGLKDPRSKLTSEVLSEGGGEEDGVRHRLDEEEVTAFFFATAAFTAFFAAAAFVAAALVWRTDCSWTFCRCTVLSGRTG